MSGREALACDGRTGQIWRDAVLGFAVGDALGAPAEFGERWMRDMDPVKEMRSGGVFDVPEGGWTDDTSMVLATMDSLQHGFSREDMMERFLAWYRRGEYSWSGRPIGVGKQMLKALERYEAERDLETCGGCAEEDNGNGSLMRILPVCLYGYLQQRAGKWTIREVLDRIHQTSALTHAHMRSKIACGLYCFIICEVLGGTGELAERIQTGLNRGFEYYQQEPEVRYYDRVRNLGELRILGRDEVRSSGYVVDTFEAVIWCLVMEDTYRDCVLKAVNLGLDTDTIAALTGAVAGLYYGCEKIPEEWMLALKDRDKIEEICHRM